MQGPVFVAAARGDGDKAVEGHAVEARGPGRQLRLGTSHRDRQSACCLPMHEQLYHADDAYKFCDANSNTKALTDIYF